MLNFNRGAYTMAERIYERMVRWTDGGRFIRVWVAHDPTQKTWGEKETTQVRTAVDVQMGRVRGIDTKEEDLLDLLENAIKQAGFTPNAIELVDYEGNGALVYGDWP